MYRWSILSLLIFSFGALVGIVSCATSQKTVTSDQVVATPQVVPTVAPTVTPEALSTPVPPASAPTAYVTPVQVSDKTEVSSDVSSAVEEVLSGKVPAGFDEYSETLYEEEDLYPEESLEKKAVSPQVEEEEYALEERFVASAQPKPTLVGSVKKSLLPTPESILAAVEIEKKQMEHYEQTDTAALPPTPPAFAEVDRKNSTQSNLRGLVILLLMIALVSLLFLVWRTKQQTSPRIRVKKIQPVHPESESKPEPEPEPVVVRKSEDERQPSAVEIEEQPRDHETAKQEVPLKEEVAEVESVRTAISSMPSAPVAKPRHDDLPVVEKKTVRARRPQKPVVRLKKKVVSKKVVKKKSVKKRVVKTTKKKVATRKKTTAKKSKVVSLVAQKRKISKATNRTPSRKGRSAEIIPFRRKAG